MKVQNILILIIIFLGLGGFFYFSNSPQPAKETDPQEFVWLIDMDQIEHITIDMPRQNLSESFIKINKEDKFPWYFDDANQTAVDSARWGGGIPLLLSGPAADRIIAKDASPQVLADFGLDKPLMKITLTLTGGHTMTIDVGDATPNGASNYVKAPSTNDVALVDASWYSVLSKLVTDPPYATAASPAS